MRIRSIKPEFWTSEDIAALSWEARLIFIGLWSYVDDNGVGRWNEKLILADLFPLEEDPRETLATLSRVLREISRRGLISLYTVENKQYLHITAWQAHQRIDKPAKARYPLPTCENVEFATPSRDPRDTLAPGAGEQGTGEQGNREQSLSSDLALRDPDPQREDVERICQHLLDRLNENGVKPQPTITKGWRTAARLLIDRDERTEAEVHKAIDWATNDTAFWAKNIRSIEKLRKHYDAMREDAKDANRGRTRTGGGVTNWHAHALVRELSQEDAAVLELVRGEGR